MFDIFKKRYTDRLVMTTTEELFIPVRLYYKIHNIHLFKKALRKLKCVIFSEEDPNYFIISYHKEAKNIDLAVHYQDVPAELYPVKLADCDIVNSVLHVDTKSFRRAINLIDFLSKQISINLIELVSFAHLNKLTVVQKKEQLEEVLDQDYNRLFDHVVCDDDCGLYNKLKELQPTNDDLTEDQQAKLKCQALELVLSFMQQEELEHYPDAEKFSIKYNKANHQELLNMLTFRAVVKETVAHKRFEGHNDYTSLDAIQEFMESRNLEYNEGN